MGYFNAYNLGYLDDANNAQYGIKQQQPYQTYNTPQQTVFRGLVNSAAQPFQSNMASTNTITQPAQNNSPTLQPEHYGEPDSNGRVPINESGFKYLNANIPSKPTISDNQNIIGIAKAAGSEENANMPDEGQPQIRKGLVGRLWGNYIGSGMNNS